MCEGMVVLLDGSLMLVAAIRQSPCTLSDPVLRCTVQLGIRNARLVAFVGGFALLFAACGPDDIEPLPPNTFAFGVFGDGPYHPWEQGRFTRVLRDASDADLAWFLHVGDMLWYPCSDERFEELRAQLNSVAHPVIYTPGDNEWTDCHEARPGRYEPLDRLASLRRIFFSDPNHSLGGRPMPVETQAGDSTFAEFVENARWVHGGFVFATIHLVGSSNGLKGFEGRTAAHDEEVERRTDAAIAWLDEAFAVAREDSAKAVALVVHGNIGIDRELEPEMGFDRFLERLEDHVSSFDGQVLLIHGDSHTRRVDQPFRDSTGSAYPNFTRIETFGSPEIGWLRVVVDTLQGRVVEVEPRLMRGWL